MQDSQGALVVRMLPTFHLKEFHVQPDRGILDTRCLVPHAWPEHDRADGVTTGRGLTAKGGNVIERDGMTNLPERSLLPCDGRQTTVSLATFMASMICGAVLLLKQHQD